MSHFGITVATKTNDLIELQRLMQPFHEFECTGVDDEYVQSLDSTSELRSVYDVELIERYVSPDGKHFAPYDERFYRKPTEEEKKKHRMIGSGGNGKIWWDSREWSDTGNYEARVQFLPEGWTKDKFPMKDCMTFDEFIYDWHGIKSTVGFGESPDLEDEHKYQYVQLDKDGKIDKIITRTNPNKKWDYWHRAWEHDGFFVDKRTGNRVDQIQVKHIDFDGEIQRRIDKVNADWDIIESITKGIAVPKFQYFKDSDKQRKAYREHHLIQALSNDERLRGVDYELSRYEALEVAKTHVYRTFAYLDETGWHERGNMGWWACVSNEKDKNDWNAEVKAFWDRLDPESYVTILDCHI